MLDKLINKSWFPKVTRIISFLFFILLVFALSIGTIRIFSFSLSSKLAMILIWTLWWPTLYITLFFAGRLWCGFICPVTLINEFGNKIRKGKTIRLMKWGFLPFVIFFIIVYFEQASGLFLSPKITLAFLAFFMGLPLIMAIFFSRSLFCRLVCPIGTLLRVFSRLSFIGVRTEPRKCSECKTFECLKGVSAPKCPMFLNIPKNRSNSLCLTCSNCIKNCPYDSAKLRVVKPGKEILDKVDFTISESLFIISLLAFVTILTTNGTRFYRYIIPINVSGILLRLLDFIIAITLFIAIYLILSYINSRISKQDFKTTIKEYGYAYLPLAFMIMLFTIIFDFLGPYIPIEPNLIAITKYVLLTIGMIWSIFIAFKLSKKKVFAILHVTLIIVIGVIWVLFLIPGSLNILSENQTRVIIAPGETIDLDAYSMGFDPYVFVVKKDQVVNIKVANKDIVHAIDIDEFEIHEILRSGRETEISFIPNKTGEFKIYCSIPGHEEAGMKSLLIVEE